jgi:TonB family protein
MLSFRCTVSPHLRGNPTKKERSELLEAQQSAATLKAHEVAESDKAPTVRLVIRARILSDAPPPKRGLFESFDRRALLVASVVGLLVLAVIMLSVFNHDTRSSPLAHEPAKTAAQAPSSTLMPATELAPTKHVDAKSPEEPHAEATIKEVLPTVSRGSLQTIHGTIKVTIRTLVNQDGTVRAATSHIPGPSRYFERVALQAAKKWTFAPTSEPSPRTVFVRFNFTRGGVTADVDRDVRT